MNDAAKQPADVWADLAARTYLTFGLIAAFALGLSLMQYADGVWAVAPTLIAIAGLMFRWLSAPVFVLLGVALALLVTQPRFAAEPTPLNDLLLAGSVIAVMLAHFRLYSITTAIFPHDPRRTLNPSRLRRPSPPIWIEMLMVLTIVPYVVHIIRRRQPARYQPALIEKRKTTLAVDEWPRAVGVIAFAATASVALWAATANIPPPLMTIPEQWRLGLMVWFALVPVFLVAAIVGYRHARRRSPSEARLILADELWRETRGEQRRIARWINWARLKRQEKLS